MKGIIVFILLGMSACGLQAAVPQIATSGSHTLALKADGALWAWGSNDRGMLGDGATIDRISPVRIGTGYSKVSSGLYASFAIKTDGSLWAWGANSDSYAGTLGDGTTTDQLTPVRTGSDFAEVAAGLNGGAAIKRDGTLWTWGRNGTSGMLGDGDLTPHIAQIPRQIDSGFVQVAGSQDHFLALKADGSLWAWGFNGEGQLGDGTYESRAVPTYVDSGYQAITAGAGYSLGIKTDGSLWAWGSNIYGQLGLGFAGTGDDPNATFETMTYPRPTLVGADYVAVTAGNYHTHAIKRDGSLWGWGSAAWGAVGDGLPDTDADGTGRNVTEPTQIGTGFWKTTSGGGNFNGYALKLDGSLWAWGNNYAGQLGDGTTENHLAPVDTGFNVYPSSGLAAEVTASGPVERRTLLANISPNSADGGKPACSFIMAALPDGTLASLAEQGWETYSATTPQSIACGSAATVAKPLLVDADASLLSGTVVYLGYGLGDTPAQSFADMLERNLWVSGYQVQ